MTLNCQRIVKGSRVWVGRPGWWSTKTQTAGHACGPAPNHSPDEPISTDAFDKIETGLVS